MDNILHMVGLAFRAGRLEVGEEPVGAACRARDCRLILIARDAADNTFRRVRHFADAGQCLWISIPYTKEELGSAVGRTACAMVAVTDVGFAEAIAKKLAAVNPEKYTITAEKLHIKQSLGIAEADDFAVYSHIEIFGGILFCIENLNSIALSFKGFDSFFEIYHIKPPV